MNRVPPTRVLSSSPFFSKRVIPWLFGVLILIGAGLTFIDIPWYDALFVVGIGAMGGSERTNVESTSSAD